MEKGTEIKVLDKGLVRYIDHMGSDSRICEAARISYRAPSKGAEQDKKLIEYLWKNNHSSPFEQCSITFNIKLPLFVQAQLVRHRTARLNQVSARYTEMKDEFYIPSQWRKQDNKNKQGSTDIGNWNPIVIPEEEIVDIDARSITLIPETNASTLLEISCKSCYESYKLLINKGIAREMARMILPQNLYTEIYWNIDLNNLMKFLNLRTDEHAQYEIREFAKAIKVIASELFPWTFEAFEKYQFKLIEKK